MRPHAEQWRKIMWIKYHFGRVNFLKNVMLCIASKPPKSKVTLCRGWESNHLTLTPVYISLSSSLVIDNNNACRKSSRQTGRYKAPVPCHRKSKDSNLASSSHTVVKKQPVIKSIPPRKANKKTDKRTWSALQHNFIYNLYRWMYIMTGLENKVISKNKIDYFIDHHLYLTEQSTRCCVENSWK